LEKLIITNNGEPVANTCEALEIMKASGEGDCVTITIEGNPYDEFLCFYNHRYNKVGILNQYNYLGSIITVQEFISPKFLQS